MLQILPGTYLYLNIIHCLSKVQILLGHAEFLFANSSNPSSRGTDNVWRQRRGRAMGISWVEAMDVAKYHTIYRIDPHGKNGPVHKVNSVTVEKHFNWLNTLSD